MNTPQPIKSKPFLSDAASGLTTAIVSLPTALAFGMASGAGPQAGVYGSVLVGLFASLFGSSTRLVSEPTGPMTVMFAAVLTTLSGIHPETGPAMAFTVVMVAGAVQLAIGLLKLGQFITLMPYAVISGFMSGIGVLLVLLQIPGVLGREMVPGGAYDIVWALPRLVRSVSFPSVAMAGLTLAFLWGWPEAWRKRCPPHLVALLVATFFSLWFWDADTLQRVGEIPMALPRFRAPVFQTQEVITILLNGLVLGMLGSVDSLLTAMIADSLTREQHDSNRELVGQGLANLVSGFFGGLPGAGATMGTVVNIQAGATGRRAGVLRALILLSAVWVAAPLLRPIPMAVLSAIAMKVGFDILDWSFIKRIPNVSRSSTLMMWVVLLLTVFVDVILAVGVGVFLANLLTIKRLSDLHSQSVRTISIPDAGLVLPPQEKEVMEEAGPGLLLFHLSGPMIFGVAKAIAREHAAMRHARALVIDLTDVPLLGVTVALAIENMIRDALASGARVWVASAPAPRERMHKFRLFEQEGLEEAPTRLEALRAAQTWLKGTRHDPKSDPIHD